MLEESVEVADVKVGFRWFVRRMPLSFEHFLWSCTVTHFFFARSTRLCEAEYFHSGYKLHFIHRYWFPSSLPAPSKYHSSVVPFYTALTSKAGGFSNPFPCAGIFLSKNAPYCLYTSLLSYQILCRCAVASSRRHVSYLVELAGGGGCVFPSWSQRTPVSCSILPAHYTFRGHGLTMLIV